MKVAFIIIIIQALFLNTCFSQSSLPIDSVTGNIKFTEIVYVDSSSKELLYTKAREWFVKSFNSSKTVLEMEDKESGKLIGKGSFTIATYESINDNNLLSDKHKKLIPKKMRDTKNMYESTMQFMIAIYVKDNKFKYEINSINNSKTRGFYFGKTEDFPGFGELQNIELDNNIPDLRRKNIIQGTLTTINNLIADLKSTMSDKDKTQEF